MHAGSSIGTRIHHSVPDRLARLLSSADSTGRDHFGMTGFGGPLRIEKVCRARSARPRIVDYGATNRTAGK